MNIKFKKVIANTQEEIIFNIENKICDFSIMPLNKITENDNLLKSSKIFDLPFALVTKIDEPYIGDLESLDSTKIAIAKDCQIDKFRYIYPKMDFVEIDDFDKVLKDVATGKYFGYIGILQSVLPKVQGEFAGKLKVAVKTDSSLNFGLIVNKDDEVLMHILQRAINSFSDYQIKDFLNKSFRIFYEKKVDYSLAIKIFIISILTVLIFTYFFFKLNLLNKNLNKQKKFLSKVLDIQPNMMFILDKSKVVFVNKFFLDFFTCKNLEEFNHRHKYLAELFLGNEKYFHLGNIIDEQYLISNVLKLNSSERVVSIENPTTGLVHYFDISIVDFEDGKYLVSLSDISDIILKQLQLEKISNHDNLTGAFSRGYFEIHKKIILDKLNKKDLLIAFSIFDIDFFKLVNDNYGHLVGDKVLVEFVDIINKCSRPEDTFVRWGGEEFILIQGIKAEKELYFILDKLRKAIEEAVIDEKIHITCSIGSTIYIQNEIVEDTLNRADKALYEAKNTGRNKVVIN